jgi:hypothetical protein
MKFLKEGHGAQALLTKLKEKYDWQNEGIIKLKFKGKRPVGQPTRRWFCQVLENSKWKIWARNYNNHKRKLMGRTDWRCPFTDQYKTLLDTYSM